jgi:hypothetical protein
MLMRVKVTEEGVTVGVRTYCINNRFISFNIEIDMKVKNKTTRWKVKSRAIVNIVIMSMLACVEKKHRLHYSRQRNKKEITLYNKRGISNYEIMKAVDELEQMGMLTNHIAPRQFNTKDAMSSWIEPTQLFISTFLTETEQAAKADAAFIAAYMPIIVRDGDKKPVDFRADEYTFAIAAVVNRLNEVNSKHVFIDPEGKEFTNLFSRIFSNSSFAQGGRFFRGNILNIENKKSKDRLRILIDGESVVEVDYTSLHLFMMAEKLGCVDKLGSDPYLMPLTPTQKMNEANRDLIKFSINTMLNCTSRLQATQAINKHFQSVPDKSYDFTRGGDVVKAIFNAFPDFKDKFCSVNCTGLELQNDESWMTHYVANVMSTLGLPFLPVHDSGIVRKSDLDTLIELMSSAYKSVLKTENVAHMKLSYIDKNALVKRDVSC